MNPKLQFKNKLKKNSVDNFKVAFICITFLYGLSVNGAEKGESSSVSGLSDSESSSGVVTSSSKILNSDQLTNENLILNNSGILEPTNFSKTTSRLDSVILKSGFTNKIIVTSSVDYDSNPALVSGEKDSVSIYTLTPQLSLDYVDELNRYYLDSAIIFQRPSNERFLVDREDPSLTVGWNRTYAYGNYELYAGYSQFLSRALQIRTTGTFTNAQNDESTQRTRSFGAKWNHNLAQKWRFEVNADYSNQAFSGGVGLIDSKFIDLKSRLNYEYSERLNTYAYIGYVQISPNDFPEDTDLVRLALGVDYMFSESLRGLFRGSKVNFTGPQSGSDWEAGAKLIYDIDRMGFTSEMNREISGVGGIGGVQRADTLALGWVFNISEKDNVSATYSIVKLKSDNEAFIALPGQKIREFNTSYNRLLRGNWNVRANLIYRELIPESGASAEGAIVGAALIYNGLSF